MGRGEGSCSSRHSRRSATLCSARVARKVVTVQRARPVPATAWLAGLFAASGAATMAHEIAWAPVARSLLGADARGIAASLIAILGGMGAGALLAPRVARRWGALGAFVRVEGAGAAYAVLVPWIA